MIISVVNLLEGLKGLFGCSKVGSYEVGCLCINHITLSVVQQCTKIMHNLTPIPVALTKNQ